MLQINTFQPVPSILLVRRRWGKVHLKFWKYHPKVALHKTSKMLGCVFGARNWISENHKTSKKKKQEKRIVCYFCSSLALIWANSWFLLALMTTNILASPSAEKQRRWRHDYWLCFRVFSNVDDSVLKSLDPDPLRQQVAQARDDLVSIARQLLSHCV